MNSITQNSFITQVSRSAAILAVVIGIGFSFPIVSNAAVSGDAGCCGDAGYTDYGMSGAGYTDYGLSNAGYTDYGVSNAGYTDYGLPNHGYTDYSPGYTDYAATPYSTYSAPYSSGYYTSPTYGYAPSLGYAYAPSYSVRPSYSAQTPYYTAQGAAPRPTAPTYSAPTSQSQDQSLYNKSTNTNTLTSNPYTTSHSSTGPITNTNTNTATASTGPINITNTVNMIPVSKIQPQTLAQYTVPQTPSCTINASSYVSYGAYSNQPITLSWSSNNATSAYITPLVGSVSTSGSTIVYPQGYTTYTLTVSGPHGTATCQATANYATNYVAPVSYVAPAVYAQSATPAVSLSQIPYTGLDYGPVGNAIYWLSLLSFAVAAGYLIVYFRGGMFAFAGSLMNSKREYNFAEVNETKDVQEQKETPVEEEAFSATSLPLIENHRITTDSMVMDHSSSTPRIVIARG